MLNRDVPADSRLPEDGKPFVAATLPPPAAPGAVSMVDPAWLTSGEVSTYLNVFTSASSWNSGVQALLARLQSRLESYRVSVGWRRGAGVALVSWTDVAPIDEGVGVAELEEAYAEALHWRQGQAWPMAADVCPSVSVAAHENLFRVQGLTGLMSVPLCDERGVAFGVLTCERIPMLDGESSGRAAADAQAVGGYARQDLAWLVALTQVLGPVLAMRHRLEQPWYVRSLDHLGHLTQRLGDPRQKLLRGLVLSFFGSGAFLFGWPMSYTVAVPAALLPRTETALVAPADGVVTQSTSHVGDLVRAGQELGRVEFRPMAAGDRRAGGDESSDALRSPYDGVVIAQTEGGRPGAQVRRGDTLWVVAPGLDWRVALQVDEQDIAAMSPGLPAVLRLSAAPDQVVHLRLRKLVPLATEGDSHLRFTVEADVVGGNTMGLRPGLVGTAWVEMPPRAMSQRAWSAVHRWWTLTWWGL